MKNPITKFYCCSTTAQWELGETEVVIYKSLKDLKKSETCWKECGIVRLEVKTYTVKKGATWAQ